MQWNDIWESAVDNTFASAVMSRIDISNILPEQQVSSLCQRCQKLNFSSSSLYTTDDITSLKQRSKKCDLCRMFFQCFKLSGWVITLIFSSTNSVQPSRLITMALPSYP